MKTLIVVGGLTLVLGILVAMLAVPAFAHGPDDDIATDLGTKGIDTSPDNSGWDQMIEYCNSIMGGDWAGNSTAEGWNGRGGMCGYWNTNSTMSQRFGGMMGRL